MRRLCSLFLVIAALGATLGAAGAAAQAAATSPDSLKRVGIRRILALQRTDSLMLAGIEQALGAQAPDPEMPDGFLEAFRARIRSDIGQFVERLVAVYDSLYTTQDVDELLAFYQTRVGQRLIETQPRLMEASMVLGEQWGMEVAGQVLVDLSRQPPKRP